MNEKELILKKITPKAVLKPVTAEAANSLPKESLLDQLILVRRFPFRVGRESRIQFVEGKLIVMERPKINPSFANNDIYLIDFGESLFISREHFIIEEDAGVYTLTDRGSSCGTMLNDEVLGEQGKVASRELKDGDIIGLGNKGTPYRFKFLTL